MSKQAERQSLNLSDLLPRELRQIDADLDNVLDLTISAVLTGLGLVAWLRDRQAHCAATHVRVLLANLSTILSDVVEDGLLARNPCGPRSVRAPKVEHNKVVPWTADRVAAVVDAHLEHHQAVRVVAAGCGLRQGEVFGLRIEDVDFLRRKVLVHQQVKLVSPVP